MSAPDIFKSLKTVAILLLFFALVVLVATYFDLASYAAPGDKVLTHEGNFTGKALVVYDPGIMDMGGKMAGWMSQDLQIRGYDVNVSGIRSQTAENATGFDVVIVIGPTYVRGLADFGYPTEPVTDYLQAAQLNSSAQIGVFAVSGLRGDDASGRMLAILEERSIPVKANGCVGLWDKDAEEECYTFMFSLLE